MGRNFSVVYVLCLLSGGVVLICTYFGQRVEDSIVDVVIVDVVVMSSITGFCLLGLL